METSKLKTLDVFVGVLLIVGGLNWGLIGIFNFDLVATIFGSMSILTRIVYSLVGLAAIYDLVFIKAIFKRWHIELRTAAHA
jgi:uncharacterized membrane protein YuzA (DUF378 family)